MFDSYAGLLEMTHHSIAVQKVDFVHSAALVAHMSAARSFVGNTPSGMAAIEKIVADMPARAGENMAAAAPTRGRGVGAAISRLPLTATKRHDPRRALWLPPLR